MRAAIAGATLALFSCTSDPGSGDPADPMDPGEDAPPEVTDPCATPVVLPTAGRPIDLMPADRLATFAGRVPCIEPGVVRDVIESERTLWYDKLSLTPGYQDSFGDNVVTPIGFRPNTIDSGLIDLAVPGGHAQIFQQKGVFHFPFGTPIGQVTNVHVIDFWRPPDDSGAYLPVVHWQRDPNEYTHRVEWMFPVGTVFGELIFMDDDGLYPFEIRTRTRTLTGWDVDAYRPFPRATDLADAIDSRIADPSPALVALIEQLRTGSLDPFHVAATHFPGAFPARDSGIEKLPALTDGDAALVRGLLLTTPFRSARGVAWKQANGLTAWAASAAGAGTIVPANYNAPAVEITEQSCDTCHRDAGRPFETWYDNILAYGELWGNDEIFTWHPFKLSNFVDDNGEVVNFNNDNRIIRADMKAAGLIEPYVPSQHPATLYKRIVREWTDFKY